MSSRYRIRSIPTSGSYISIVNGVYQSTSNYSGNNSQEECWDEIGSVGVDHTLTVKKLEAGLFTPITGACTVGVYSGSYLTQPCYGNLLTTANAHLAISLPSVGQEVTKLLGLTNPSRAVINPLTLFQDFADIPKQLRSLGDLANKGGTGGKVKVNDGLDQFFSVIFGWAPLIDDLQKLSTFMSSVHKRAGEIERLYSKSGLKRRLNLGTYGAEATTANYIATSYPACIVQGKLQKTTRVERWGTVRWRPDVRPRYRPGDRKLLRQLERVVGGLSVEGMSQGVWDLIPWSFVIDWFSDIGGFMKIYSNAIPASPTHVNIMTKTTTWTTFTPSFRSQGMSGGSGQIYFETKERAPNVAPVMRTAVHFLHRRQLSLLGALFSQRILR